MKFISKLGKAEKDLNILRGEINILRRMKHENIVEMIHSFETNTEVSLILFLETDRFLCCCFFLRLLLLLNVVWLIFINC